ncbi:hypothetical protein FOA52_006039 [Chlamydomonas sp. UWO 241]|nr:hypothetical protein FOA52_006039 [Chlamydomonas sp. UWO 241]
MMMMMLAVLAALGWAKVVVPQGIYASPAVPVPFDLPKAPRGAWLPVVQVTNATYQPGCDVPTTQAPNFSATQIALLAEQMESTLTPDCCLTEAVLSPDCCLGGVGMINRCLGDIFLELDSSFSGISCPINETQWQEFARAQWGLEPKATTQEVDAAADGNETSQQSTAAAAAEADAALGSEGKQLANVTTTSPLWTLPEGMQGMAPDGGALMGDGCDFLGNCINMTMSQGDSEYYESCKSEPVTPWADFNMSHAFDIVLVLAREASQECLRIGMTYLPLCYGDLMMKSGCCSLQCRAAFQRVPINCYTRYLLAICANLPDLSKYLFNTALRCTGYEISCQAFNSTNVMLAGSGGLAARRDIPLVATEEGDCPIDTVLWPDFDHVTLLKEVLGVLPDSNASALANCGEHQHRTVAQIYSACYGDMRVKTGCCSQACALSMRSMTASCLELYMRAFHSCPSVAKYMDAMFERCMGSNIAQVLGNNMEGTPATPAAAGAAGATAGDNLTEAAAAARHGAPAAAASGAHTAGGSVSGNASNVRVIAGSSTRAAPAALLTCATLALAPAVVWLLSGG